MLPVTDAYRSHLTRATVTSAIATQHQRENGARVSPSLSTAELREAVAVAPMVAESMRVETEPEACPLEVLLTERVRGRYTWIITVESLPRMSVTLSAIASDEDDTVWNAVVAEVSRKVVCVSILDPVAATSAVETERWARHDAREVSVRVTTVIKIIDRLRFIMS